MENHTHTRSLGSRKERTTTTKRAGGRPGPNIRWEAGGGWGRAEVGGGCWKRGEGGGWMLEVEG